MTCRSILIALMIPVLLPSASKAQQAPALTEAVAAQLAALPLRCIDQQFPNKTSHTADSATDARLLPAELHPAFYGCFDWHSSVHGHWMLVRLLKTFPGLANRAEIIRVLDGTFQKDKMAAEAAYFTRYKVANTFERTYGWAWLLKLDEELATWDDPNARRWHETLQPLTGEILRLWKAYLPKQTYPNRTGVHPNTAFAMVFALDWARALKDTAFERQVIERSLSFYKDSKATPAYLEPDGSDFFSPSLEIADLMRRILPAKAFVTWLNGFYEERSIARICSLPTVSDRSDYQIVHLDGLSFSRAWCMKGIARQLPAGHKWKKRFMAAADTFLARTLPQVTGGYGGEHWLASFAVYALE
ncbi:DUF2891 domain-containing protein [Taibaiella koreensis]|uniref:DUF2891 domain-containing protein n=1 Tax=Taibaiella koreensis TaxID=1268548 RepID=UPI001968B2AA|nr:DUF2891 domain-containing protein [Taibaiella koreensis]